MTIIFIVVVLILIYLIYKKSLDNKERFENVELTRTEYNNILNNYIKNKITITPQGIRTFSDLCNYFHSDSEHFILPSDTIINAEVKSNNITINGNCTLTGYTEINNLTVTGSVTIKNKDKYNEMTQYLDILPKGSIIPWNRDEIPKGWVIANGDIRKSITNNINIPPICDSIDKFFKGGNYILGINQFNSGQTGGTFSPIIKEENLPEHTHDINIGFTQGCFSDTSNKLCKENGFFLTNNFDQLNPHTGNINKVYSYSGNYGISGANASLDFLYPTIAVYYIMKI